MRPKSLKSKLTNLQLESEKGEKTQFSKIRNKIKDITTNLTAFNKIITDYIFYIIY